MGIFLYNRLKSARAVPVLINDISGTHNAELIECSMAVGTWIGPPQGDPDLEWTKIIKITDELAWFYYSARTCKSHLNLSVQNDHVCIEDAVSDVLCFKLHNKKVVDAGHDDVVEILTDLHRLL
jgi:hypothetical protein